METKTWTLFEFPPGQKAVGCKWVSKLKHVEDGTMERFKARLVAKGYAQKYEIDYDETTDLQQFVTAQWTTAILSNKQGSVSSDIVYF